MNFWPVGFILACCNSLWVKGGDMAKVEVESEVTGNVWKVQTTVGATVAAGDVLMILESMKMEIPIEAPAGGTLVELLVAEEEAVDEDQVLAIIEAV